MIVLENSELQVEISEKGAEIQRIIQKQANFNYIWSDNNQGIWKRHAPILFPFIGKSNQDQYRINQQTFPMSQHGFGRDQTFIAQQTNDTAATFTFTANESTKKAYPFAFSLKILYTLKENQLQVKFEVINQDTKSMSFALGVHPGFNVPLNGEGSFEDYSLKLNPATISLKQWEIGPAPFRTGNIIPFTAATENNVIPLTHKLLDDGLIILENKEITQVTLQSNKTSHSVSLSTGDFPYLAMWSPEKKQAPFLCIEPFAGLPDKYGDITELFAKQGNMLLDAGKTKKLAYQLELK
ncbi:aldose 1-epimerase family protein [Loigolactobacillus iwatensis]|uniref:aldose 1-epimerase family protein n=1 Tax=Loigolactobacillus iwatensis TaxID=1267156 RepID=UPI000F7DA949|nr:aldose 1-epimerase family protein [Loigolactobacillus iwatensis]